MISIKNLTKTYISGQVETKVLQGINLEVSEGEFVAIMGRSGAGKSTLLYQMSLLDRPTAGEITLAGVDVLSLSDKERTFFRLEELGYIFQDYALVPDLTAVENVMVPLLMLGLSYPDAREIASQALEQVGMDHRIENLPSQLSGGEQQRVSVARAVAQEPTILFADEPTANLDTTSGEAVLAIMRKLHADGQTIVMVTHEPEYTRFCDRVITLEDGVVLSETKPKSK